MASQRTGVTALLHRWADGDAAALEQLIPLAYDDLRAVARGQLHGERSLRTLQPTALVHEFYLRLFQQRTTDWNDREHFLAFAGMMMRRILTDYARKHRTAKRGGGAERLPISEDVPWLGSSAEEIVALDEALTALERIDARKARIFELRALLGCQSGETAGLLGISKATADREWTLARAWLHREISRKAPAQS